MGNKYGVIRDPNVKVRTCNVYGTTSSAVGVTADLYSNLYTCLASIIEDLEAEKENNADVRAVINLSLGFTETFANMGQDYEAYWNDQFQNSMWFVV